jgi:hypothetical protein
MGKIQNLFATVFARFRMFSRKHFVLRPNQTDPFGKSVKFEGWTFVVGVLLFLIPLSVKEIPIEVRYLCFALAWFTTLFLFLTWPPFMGRVPRATRFIGALIFTGAIGWVAYPRMVSGWKEDRSSATSGMLEARASEDPNSTACGANPCMQFGPEKDGTTIAWAGLKDLAPMQIVGENFFLKKEHGKLLLTTRVRDSNGSIVVEINDNKWTVNPSEDVSWDKNYSKNALEVKDRRGRIVLQIILFANVVRVQGEWWTENRNGARVLRPYPFQHPQSGPVFIIMSPLNHPDEPHIEPIFKYPSKEHWGEFVDWFRLQP